MKYLFNKDPGTIKERVCRINGVRPEQLDVSGFRPDYDNEILKEFKEKLLAEKDKRFFIVGDYDCDGICATTIMMRLFADLKIRANYYIPSRSKDGYGLNSRIVDTAAENDFDCLLCVDNGVAATEQLEYAAELGLKTFVIDHHEYSRKPEVDAFLHPDLFEEDYADMCAGGLCALLSNSIREDELTEVYGGLATLADMVSVFGYNRYMLGKMLEILNREKIYPIHYLLSRSDVTYDSLAFNVIPKINAVSRLDEQLNVNYVVRYLLDNSSGCMAYLNKIEMINTERKDLSKQMAALASRIREDVNGVFIVRSQAFKEGLCGLIANRLMNECGRPILVFAENDGELKGSGRAPQGCDLYAYLKGISKIFTAYGGHQQAVGLSMKGDDYEKLKEYIINNDLKFEEQYCEVLCITKDDLDLELLKELDELKPFGSGFAEPLLCLENVEYSRKYLISKSYPKFVLNENTEAISFNPGFADKDFSTMIGHLKKDDYHRGKLSFVIEDLL